MRSYAGAKCQLCKAGLVPCKSLVFTTNEKRVLREEHPLMAIDPLAREITRYFNFE